MKGIPPPPPGFALVRDGAGPPDALLARGFAPAGFGPVPKTLRVAADPAPPISLDDVERVAHRVAAEWEGRRLQNEGDVAQPRPPPWRPPEMETGPSGLGQLPPGHALVRLDELRDRNSRQQDGEDVSRRLPWPAEAAAADPAAGEERGTLEPGPPLALAGDDRPLLARAPSSRAAPARGEGARAIMPRSQFEAELNGLMRPGVTEAGLASFARRNGYQLDPHNVRRAVRAANDVDRSSDWLSGAVRINEARNAADRAAPNIVPASDLIVVDPHMMAYHKEMTAWLAAHPKATAREISDASRAVAQARYEGRYMISEEAARPYMEYRRGGGRYSAAVVPGPDFKRTADRFTGRESDQNNSRNMRNALNATSDGHGNIDLVRLRRETRPTLADSTIRGVVNLRQTGGAFTEAAGELLGSESLARYGREVRERNAAIQAVIPQGVRFTEIRNIGDALQWAKQTAGEQAPMMAPGVGGAMIGGRFVGTWGAVVGAFIPSEVLGVGETQINLKRKDPNAKAGVWTLLGGTAIAALDSALPGRLGGKLVRRYGAEAAEAIAMRALTRPVPAGIAAAGREGGKGMALEGITEAMQEAIGEFSSAAGAGQAPDLRSLPGRMLEAGAAGALIGLGSGTAAGGVESSRSVDPASAFDGPYGLTGSADRGLTGFADLVPPESPAIRNVEEGTTLPTLSARKGDLVIHGLSEQGRRWIETVLPEQGRLLPRSDGAYTAPRKYETELRAALQAEGDRVSSHAALQRGDEPLAAVKPTRAARTLDDARNAAGEFLGKPLENERTGLEATLSGKNLKKMTHYSAHIKSKNPVDHARAVANVDQLFRVARRIKTKADDKGDPNIASVQRYVAPLVSDGRVVMVKMTVKETARSRDQNPLYTLEAIDVEDD
jgi:hypothetical protein